MIHLPVMVERVLGVLAPRPGEVFADLTAGMGGHAAAVAARLGPGGTVVLNDCDPTHLESAAARVRDACGSACPRVVPVRGNFADLPSTMAERGLCADMVLADLGFSSAQMEQAARGLSFMRDGPLDMRLDPALATTAADLVNSLTEEELAQLIREFGEERAARRIARKLAQERTREPISTTGRLAELVRSVAGPRTGGIDPATRTFQALRIAVNDELGELERGLAAAHDALRPGGRLAVVSFHSLEDRAVKEFVRARCGRAAGPSRHAPPTVDGAPASLREVTRRPVVPSPDEIARNPRARSARLRVAEKLALSAEVA